MAKAAATPTINIKCPLAPEHCAVLTKVLQECSDLSCLLDKLTSIPVDVSIQIAENDSNAALAAKIKALFFPGEP